MNALTDNPLLHAAQAWFDAGFAVVPSHEDGGKRPYGRWKEYQNERMNWDELHNLLETGRYTGIGVLTGKASLNVEMIEIEGPIDLAIERLNKVVAQATRFELISNQSGIHDLLLRVTRGCIEESAGGGMHIFIRVMNGPAQGNTKLASVGGKVVAETRGEGGFVVVAPTPARNGHAEGTSYVFRNGGSPQKVVEVTTDERDTLHALFEIALNEEPVVVQEPVKAPVVSNYQGTSAFDEYRERITWHQLLEPAGWTWSHKDAEHDYWVRPGKNKAEGISASTIDDGPLYNWSSSVNLPIQVGLSKATVYAHLHHNGDMSNAARDLGAQGYGSGTYPQLAEFVWNPSFTEDEQEAQREAWLTNVTEKFPRINWAELWADEREEEWIVEPLLAARRLVALYSAPKVGKSLLMLEIAAAIANGKELFGYPAQPPKRTLYVDFENDPRGDTKTRLIDMGYVPEQLENLVVLSFPTMASLDSEKGSNELMAAVTAYDCTIVVIDTVSRAIEGEENENDTWLNFYRHTGLKMKQAGISMIRLDHSGKDGSKGQRGGSAKSGDVDAVWRMTRDEDMVTLKCEAERFPVGLKEFSLHRLENPLRHEITVNTYATQRDALFALMFAKGIPKDPTMLLKDVKQLMRDKEIHFKNGRFNSEFFGLYCSLPSSWKPQSFPIEIGSK